MKATGIVRRIDDLGRVVIPKEIRRTLRLREGEALEIYTGETGEVIFKKYSQVGESAEKALDLCESMWRTVGLPAAVCDRDRVLTAAGPARKEVTEKPVTDELDTLMQQRRPYRHTGEKPVRITENGPTVLCMAPIINDGDVTGCVAFFGEEKSVAGEAEMKVVQSSAAFLGK